MLLVYIAILLAICLALAICLFLGGGSGRVKSRDDEEEESMALVDGKREFGWKSLFARVIRRVFCCRHERITFSSLGDFDW